MILNTCAKRSVSQPSLQRLYFGTIGSNCAIKASTRCHLLFENVVSAPLLRSCCGPRFCQRYFSASAPPSTTTSKGSVRRAPKQRPQKRHSKKERSGIDNSPQQNEITQRWPTLASAMIVPFMFAAYGISDWMFGNRTRGHNKGLRKEFLEEQRNHHGKGNDFLSSLEAKPTLFHCVIRKNQGLMHCLPGVQLGDVVEVLEEGVGPDKAYNLCRLPAKSEATVQLQEQQPRDTYGWFPIRWLQKLDHYESMVREQRIKNMSVPDPQ